MCVWNEWARAADSVVASGPRAAGVIPIASDRVLKEGEEVMIGLSTRFEGYASVSGDTVPVGQVDSSLNKHRDNLVEAFRIAREQLVPGRSAQEMDAPVRAFLDAKGYAPYLVCPFFHTLGLNEADHPFFGPNSHDRLEEGMVISIDVSTFGHPEFPGGRLETVYAITATSAEALAPGVEAALLN